MDLATEEFKKQFMQKLEEIIKKERQNAIEFKELGERYAKLMTEVDKDFMQKKLELDQLSKKL